MPICNLEHLVWDVNPTNTLGTAGTFLKAYEKPFYYKLSAGNGAGVVYGHEAVNEVIVARLLEQLGIEHLKYTGCNAIVRVKDAKFVTYVCKSREFKKPTESKIRVEMYYDLYRQSEESAIKFLHRVGFEDYVNTLLLVDFLIINRDRHGANIEFLYDKNSGIIRPAPIFDNGVSFVSPYQNNIDLIQNFDAMRDVQANNFLGTFSLVKNLQYITKSVLVNKLSLQQIDKLFYGLHAVLSKEHIDKIKEIIIKRYNYAKNKKILRER